MTADSIFQLEQPFFLPYYCPAQKNVRFDANILDLFNTDNLIDIDPKELVMIIFHAQPQGTDISAGTAHGNYIHRTVILHQKLPPFIFFIITHSFDNSKKKFLVASPLSLCYNNKKR